MVSSVSTVGVTEVCKYAYTPPRYEEKEVGGGMSMAGALKTPCGGKASKLAYESIIQICNQYRTTSLGSLVLRSSQVSRASQSSSSLEHQYFSTFLFWVVQGCTTQKP
jgi:hypothetical protein